MTVMITLSILIARHKNKPEVNDMQIYLTTFLDAVAFKSIEHYAGKFHLQQIQLRGINSIKTCNFATPLVEIVLMTTQFRSFIFLLLCYKFVVS